MPDLQRRMARSAFIRRVGSVRSQVPAYVALARQEPEKVPLHPHPPVVGGQNDPWEPAGLRQPATPSPAKAKCAAPSSAALSSRITLTGTLARNSRNLPLERND